MKFGLLLRILVSAGLVAWLLSQHDLLRTATPPFAALQQHWQWVAAGLLCMGCSNLGNAVRWWLLLRPHCLGLTLSSVLRMTLVGGFFNITSLGSLGSDAYRVLALREGSKLSALQAGVSIFIEHLAGFLSTVVLYALTAVCALYFWQEAPVDLQPMLRKGALALLAFSVLLGLAVWSLSPGFYARYGRWSPRMVRPFLARVVNAQQGFQQQVLPFMASVLTSVVALLFYFLSFYCGVRAVGGMVAWVPVLLAMPLVDLLSGLPVSMSGLGVREKSFEFLMGALTGMAAQVSVAGALVGWLFSVMWGLLGGVLYLLGGKKST
jgi:glycosyltransferase 2 family protein